eukprot:1178319-Prorocentrum_minimum.AAC.1
MSRVTWSMSTGEIRLSSRLNSCAGPAPPRPHVPAVRLYGFASCTAGVHRGYGLLCIGAGLESDAT